MSFIGDLLPYQVEAVERMCKQGRMLVAYDLGLGKTVLTISAIEKLRDQGKISGPGLVVCLSSLKYQWASQIKKFTGDSATALVIDGTPAIRLRQYASAKDYDYVIINYEQAVKDFDFIKKMPRAFIVADEATALKSFKSKRSKCVKKLTSPYVFALTGTPVENGKAEELFSIMEFVDPKILGRFIDFEFKHIVRNYFGGIERYKNLDVLYKKLSTACVRKRQSDPDVAPYLPETMHAAPILVPLDKASQSLYDTVIEQLLADLDEAVETFSELNLFSEVTYDPIINEIKGRIMSKVTVLRMLCDHPELVMRSGTLNNSDPLGIDGSKYAGELVNVGVLDRLVKAPKLDVLKEIVVEFLSQNVNNKIVIFTSFVHMVDIIAKEFDGFNAQTFTGRMNAKEKEDAKVNFQTNPSTRIIVSSDAGGYGVDLPQANLLINYDLPWNAGLATQRNGRIQRASSTWEHVVIQDILIKDSIEERQYEMLQQKLSVASAIVDGEGLDSKGSLELTVGSLRQFLQSI
jgi:SNF2 family DNA or RNA helicase